MVQRWVSLASTSLLSLTLFSTLLVLKGGMEGGGGEVRQAEGFEAHHGDLVFELAKVSTMVIIKVMTMNVIMNHDECDEDC